MLIGDGSSAPRPAGAFPTQPNWDVDADHIQVVVDHLSAALRTPALQHDATFLDTHSLGVGHDSCTAPADRYTVGLVPTRIVTPLHPDAGGSKAVGRSLADAIRTYEHHPNPGPA